VFIRSLQLKKFRCIDQLTLDFTSPIALIEGPNGVGKTSVLEALHYGCYLRSFRTYSPRELIAFDQQAFSLAISFEQTELGLAARHDLHVGFGDKKRLVKLNQKAIHSYKELMDYYRIITLTEDDMGLVKLGPDVRRAFVDQAIMLYNPAYLQLLKEYKVVLDNRNQLLQQARVSAEGYALWTEQLWHKTRAVQQERTRFLQSLQQEVEAMLSTYFPEGLLIHFAYVAKKKSDEAENSDAFMARNERLKDMEQRFGRSLFGAHLDDVAISFGEHSSRIFASRGQQKLIILLIKMAQLKALAVQKGPAVFLLDDFMTDFDQDRAQLVLKALMDLKSQLIFTAPERSSILGDILQENGAERFNLSI